MSKNNQNISNREAAPGTYTSYITGFVLSLALTALAYLLVVNGYFSGVNQAVAVVIGLAIAQLFVQLIFFLHLGRESKPRWNAMALIFAAIVVVVVVLGSIWIMKNLDYNMHQSDKQIIKDELPH